MPKYNHFVVGNPYSHNFLPVNNYALFMGGSIPLTPLNTPHESERRSLEEFPGGNGE